MAWPGLVLPMKACRMPTRIRLVRIETTAMPLIWKGPTCMVWMEAGMTDVKLLVLEPNTSMAPFCRK